MHLKGALARSNAGISSLAVSRAVLIALAVLAFLGISALIARWLTTESRERGAVQRLLSAPARGGAAGIVRPPRARLPGRSALPRHRRSRRPPAAPARRREDPVLRLEDGLCAGRSDRAHPCGMDRRRPRLARRPVRPRPPDRDGAGRTRRYSAAGQRPDRQ